MSSDKLSSIVVVALDLNNFSKSLGMVLRTPNMLEVNNVAGFPGMPKKKKKNQQRIWKNKHIKDMKRKRSGSKVTSQPEISTCSIHIMMRSLHVPYEYLLSSLSQST